MDVPKNLQDKLAQFQTLQGQMQMISMQKQQLMIAQSDVKHAQKELENYGGGKVYRMAGSLLLESTKDAVGEKLVDEAESSDAKLKVLEKQEKKLSTKLNELRVELQSLMGGQKAQ